MAIVGVRSRGIQSLAHRVKTDLLIWQNNGTRSGESNTFPAGSFNTVLGRALNFGANRAATRIYPICRINRKAPI